MALRPINILSICAGIGGLDTGLRRAVGDRARVAAYVEGEAYAAAVLVARMQDTPSFDETVIWSDVKTFDAKPWRGVVDIITAGFPCQPFSQSGKRKGAEDPRHLWPNIAAHVYTIRPAILFCENVPGLLTLGFEQVVQDLSAMGYFVEAGIFSAAEIGAPHLRKRLFFIAYPDREYLRQQFGRGWSGPCGQNTTQFEQHGGEGAVANPPSTARKACASNTIQVKQTLRQRPAARADSAANVADTERNHVQRVRNVAIDSHNFQKSNKRLHSERQKSANNCASGSSYVANAYSQRWHMRWAQSALHKRRVRSGGRNSQAIAAHDGEFERRLGRNSYESARRLDRNPWADGWEDGIPRVTTGQPHRVDRLRALGNAVVPGVAQLAFTTLVNQALQRTEEDDASAP